MQTPSFMPDRTWVPAPDEYQPVEYGSVYPPIKKLPDGRLVIDQCRRADGTYEVRIFDNRDHPNMGLLPDNAPRAVRALYKRENQLMFLRSTDAMTSIRLMDAAFNALDSR